MQIPVQFKNNKHQILNGIIHKPKKYDTAIVFLHGFPGSMFGTAQRLLTLFSKFNFLCFRFEFAGTNTSEGKFEEKLMSQEIKDTKYAIDFLQKNYPTKRIILIGHSTGATI